MNRQASTILITDSGLGGLSVFADIADRLKKTAPFEKITLVYFNAWPFQDKGYNHLPDMNARADIFNNALKAMAQFNPDTILIACNTLSVIYPFTAFSRTTDIDVTGIVEHGVQLIHKHLTKTPDSRVVIFGTPTTTGENTHKKALVKMGIAKERIINQGCVNLAGKIERDPFSEKVSRMIDTNAAEASLKLGSFKGKVFAALCCTHFGYRSDLFSTALSSHTRGKILILNPNIQMAQMACKEKAATRVSFPKIEMKIVSRVFWEKARIMAYEKLLKEISPRTTEALKGYTLDRKLFQVT